MARGDESVARRSSELLSAGCGPWGCGMEHDCLLPLLESDASKVGRQPLRRLAALSLDLRRNAATPLMPLTFRAVLTSFVTTCLRGCSIEAARMCGWSMLELVFCGSPPSSGGSSGS